MFLSLVAHADEGESWRPQYYRCPEACGGLIAVREPNGAYNIVCVRAVVEHCSHKRTGCGPGIVVLTLCAAFSVRPWSLPSGRPRADGPSQS